jgi:DNA-binding CsgD family transcriptional regulator
MIPDKIQVPLMPSIMVIKDEGDALYNKIQKLIEEESTSEKSYGPDVINLQEMVHQPGDCNQGSLYDRPKLSRREAEVLQLLAMGKTPDQMALKLGITPSMVRKHLYRLRAKFKTDSRDQLMAMAGYLRLCNPYQVE